MMKSSLGRLKKFAFQQKSDAKERRDFPIPAKFDEIALASQEMQDMRNCYDSLLSAAAATANSAYEFSESLRDLGSCLLEKTALYNNEESGNALLMLGKVQLDLQKLLDQYRSHIFLTITNPSESLLNELKTVEEMKQQCDEKRSVYEYMVAQEREKGKSKSGKGDSFTLEQLQAAHSDYEEEATLCVFRLKSLKEGQSRSLLTQAARHHTAQLNFFRKGLKYLESADLHVKPVADKHHIDYQLGGLDEGEDDEGDGDGDGDNGYDSNGGGELSFKYQHQKPGLEMASTSRNSMELDQEDLTLPRPPALEKPETIHQKHVRADKPQVDMQALESEHRISSHSAPILPEKKFDPAERIKQMRPSRSQKFHSYVLPTPLDAKTSISSRTSASLTRPNPYSWNPSQLQRSKTQSREYRDESMSAPILKADLPSFSRKSHDGSTHLPLPSSADGHTFSHESQDPSDTKKIKRQSSFSGPLTSKHPSARSNSAVGDPTAAPDLPKHIPGSLASSRLSSNISSSASPPKISELHELPRPPSNTIMKSTKTFSSLGHSAPLTSRPPELPSAAKTPSSGTAIALPLAPPSTAPRSLSVPSSRNRAVSGSSQVLDKVGEIASPPLTPITLAAVLSTEASSRPGDV